MIEDKQYALELAAGTVRIFKVTIHALHDHAQDHEPFTIVYTVEAYNDQDAIEAAKLYSASVLHIRPIIFCEAILVCEVDITSQEINHE